MMRQRKWSSSTALLRNLRVIRTQSVSGFEIGGEPAEIDAVDWSHLRDEVGTIGDVRGGLLGFRVRRSDVDSNSHGCGGSENGWELSGGAGRGAACGGRNGGRTGTTTRGPGDATEGGSGQWRGKLFCQKWLGNSSTRLGWAGLRRLGSA